MRVAPVIPAFVLTLAACTLTPRGWHRAGSTPADFEADKAACTTEANALHGRFSASFAQEGAFDRCMTGRGWTPAAARRA